MSFLHKSAPTTMGMPFSRTDMRLVWRVRCGWARAAVKKLNVEIGAAFVLFRRGKRGGPRKRFQPHAAAHCFAFWLKPGTYAFSLVLITAFIRHSRLLTILPNSSPLPSAFSGSALASQFVRWLSPKVHCWWSFARRDCFFPTST